MATKPAHIEGAHREPEPEAVEALRKAVQHYRKGAWADAAIAAAAVAETHARYAAAYHLLALALDNLGQRTKAFEMYEHALALDPTNANLYLEVGQSAAKLKLLDGAEKAFRAYRELLPDCPKGANHLACSQRDVGHFDEAAATVADALAQHPTDASLWNTNGTILSEAANFEAAIDAYAEAHRLQPAARTLHNMAHSQSHIGRFDEAINNYTQALAQAGSDQERVEITHARSHAYAAAGRLSEAWQDYEARHHPAFAQGTHFSAAAPRWDGEDLEGRKLLLIGEQGLGDEIMFASLIPDLLDRIGPNGKLLVAADQRLMPLLQRSFPDAHIGTEQHTLHNARPVRVVPWATGRLKPDFYAPMGSLLALLRPSIESFANAQAYLKPDAARVSHWIDRLAALGPGPYVGISWKSMVASAQRRKFFANLKDWKPVLELTAVKFVNLQYGNCKAERDTVCQELGVTIHNLRGIDLTNDIDDNAALCAALDLVVSPPTAPATIAAATGTETWMLTAGRLWPQLGTDRYPWYPQTRVLTPEKFGDWPALMQRLAHDLEAFASR
jgi:Flp pilus assembly protein TadD